MFLARTTQESLERQRPPMQNEELCRRVPIVHGWVLRQIRANVEMFDEILHARLRRQCAADSSSS